MNKIKAVVFDWDGTIVDSTELKRQAWITLFPPHTKPYFVVQKMMPDLLLSTRSQILQKVFEEYKPANLSKGAFVDKYSLIYRDTVEQGILKKGFLPGAKETIENLHGKIPMYINSATPEEPLLSVVEKIGIKKYFNGVYGRALAQENHTQHDLKVENLKDIAKKENFKPQEIMMVGDAEADEKSAKIFGCQFFKVDSNTNFMLNFTRYLNIDITHSTDSGQGGKS